VRIALDKGLKKRLHLLPNLFRITLIGKPLFDVLNNVLIVKLQNYIRERYRHRGLHLSSLIANDNTWYRDRKIENVLFKALNNKIEE
jgi:hypothetical protein